MQQPTTPITPLRTRRDRIVDALVAQGGAAPPGGGDGGGGGVTDHGALTGLADDDHPQYLTTGRGDARYSPVGHTHPIAGVVGLQAALDGKAATTHTHTIPDVVGLASALSLKADASELAGLQPLDATLTSLAALPAATGLVEQATPGTFAHRPLGVASAEAVPTRGDADARYAPIVHTHPLPVGALSVSIVPAEYGTAERVVSVPGVTSAHRVLAMLSPSPDWDADELSDHALAVVPESGALRLTISRPGPIGGSYAITYLAAT